MPEVFNGRNLISHSPWKRRERSVLKGLVGLFVVDSAFGMRKTRPWLCEKSLQSKLQNPVCKHKLEECRQCSSNPLVLLHDCFASPGTKGECLGEDDVARELRFPC